MIIENWLFLVLVVSILIVPGPSNALLASSGVQAGLWRTLLLIPVQLMGFWYGMGIWGLFLNFVDDIWPSLPLLLKIGSAAYMGWVAFKLWRTSSIILQKDKKPITVSRLFFITLINPKPLLLAVAVLPDWTWDSVHNYLLVMLAFACILLPVSSLWVLFGRAMAYNQLGWVTTQRLQRLSAVVLVAFAIPLIVKLVLPH